MTATRVGDAVKSQVGVNSFAEQRADQFCKVPQRITWLFWLTKSCATTVGETLSDYFNVDLGLGLGGCAALFFPLLFLNLCFVFYWPKYNPCAYWLAVVLMSICGTIMTDGLHDNLGVELWIEVIVFFFLMCVAFAWWFVSEGTLNIHSIFTTKREAFYWSAVIFTFALGTAVGDGISEAAGIGFGATFGLFCGALIVIYAAFMMKGLDEVTAFWFAYIMTRPLGAAAGDLIASPKSVHAGGVGVGGTSLIFAGIIIACVIYVTVTKYDVESPHEPMAVDTKDPVEGKSAVVLDESVDV